MTANKIYPELDPRALEPQSAIAEQLAWRDQRLQNIEALAFPKTTYKEGEEDGDYYCDECSHLRAVGDYVTSSLAAENARLTRELAAAQASLDQLPDKFSLIVFYNAGMALEECSTALTVARRVLEEAETDRYEAARTAAAGTRLAPKEE